MDEENSQDTSASARNFGTTDEVEGMAHAEDMGKRFGASYRDRAAHAVEQCQQDEKVETQQGDAFPLVQGQLAEKALCNNRQQQLLLHEQIIVSLTEQNDGSSRSLQQPNSGRRGSQFQPLSARTMPRGMVRRACSDPPRGQQQQQPRSEHHQAPFRSHSSRVLHGSEEKQATRLVTVEQGCTPPSTMHRMESDILAKIVEGQVRLRAIDAALEGNKVLGEDTAITVLRDLEAKALSSLPYQTLSDVEAMEAQQKRLLQQYQQQQQQPRRQPQQSGCGSCDDCRKMLPCLAARLDCGPGAFSVSWEGRVRRSPLTITETTNRGPSPSFDAYSRTHSPTQQLEMPASSQEGLIAEVLTAELVLDGDAVEADERQLRQREMELQQREMQLAEQARQLQALQEQLELQRLLMEGGHVPRISNHSRIKMKSREILSAQVILAVPELASAPSAPLSPRKLQQHGPVAQVNRAILLDHTSHHLHELDNGPKRFAPPEGILVANSTSTRHLMQGLDGEQLEVACRHLQQKWQRRQDRLLTKKPSKSNQKLLFDLTPQWHCRYLWTFAKKNKSDESYSFSVHKAFAAEKKLHKRYVDLNIGCMREQIKSKTLFPVPGLKTMGGHSMFYMRPSRYFPGQTTTKMIIDNLCYVMNTMVENSQFAQKEGIGFIACMDDWKMKNFEVNYCYQFMMALQGFMVPVKTQLFLIVNPPSWFGTIWKIMKPMLAPSFRKRVKICPGIKISKYLQPGYEQYLPDDMTTGRANTDEMIHDFVAYREYVEPVFSNGVNHDGSDHQSSIGENDDMESLGQLSNSEGSLLDLDEHSPHSSLGCLSAASSELGDDDASINCDIDEEAELEANNNHHANLSNRSMPPNFHG